MKLRVEQLHLAVVSLSTVVTHASSLQHYAFLPAGYVDGSAPGTFEGTQNEEPPLMQAPQPNVAKKLIFGASP